MAHLPRDQTASVNGSLPAAREADRGVGPLPPGRYVPAVIQHLWRRHSAALAGLLASGLVTSPEEAAYAVMPGAAPAGRVRAAA
jgi:hypothetical protein